MSMLLVILTLGGSPGDSDRLSQKDEPRGYHEISKDMRELLRAEAKAKSLDERGEAIRRMSTLYLEIVHDPRLSTSDTLASYKTKMWSRLLKIKRELEIKLAREQKKLKTIDSVEDEQAIKDATNSLAAQMSLVGSTLGGPGNVFSHGGAGGGTITSNAQSLIDLIERTINPDFWDVNGGPGTIMYYAPLQALVVRASSEVHRNIGGAIGGLRKAGN